MLDQIRERIKIDKKHRENIFDRRHLKEVVQLSTLRLNEPTEEELRDEINFVERIFSMGDKMYKYAKEFYGDTEHWWLIAWFNNKPTDVHWKIGETVYIPVPLDRALVIATREK